MAQKAVTFQYFIKHKLTIEVTGNNVTFNEADQQVYVTAMSISPAMEISKIDVTAHYPNGAAASIADAVQKILNTGAKAEAAKTTTRVSPNTVIKAEDIKKTNESANNVTMSVQVITDMLDIATQVNVDGGNFKIQTKSSDMSEFVTFRQSKKIKIFINGKEFAPKEEMEFIKRVFPQVDMTVYLK